MTQRPRACWLGLSRRWCPIAALVAMIVLVSARWAHAGTPPQLEVLGAWGGPVNTVAFNDSDDSIAYVGSGRRVVVLDITDVTNIVELSSVDVVQTVQDLAYQDGYLYVATRLKPYRFCVVDVSDPRNAHIVWTTPPTASVSGTPLQVHLRGDRAYVKTATDLWVYDIADPTNVAILGKAIETFVQDVVIVDDLAYVAAGVTIVSAGLKIFDLSSSDPLNPELVGSVDVQPSAVIAPMRLAVTGDRAYLAYKPGPASASLASLAVIDISSPSVPEVKSDSPLSTTLAFNTITGIDASATHVYATMVALPAPAQFGIPDWPNYPGLMIFDVTATPDVPVLITSYKAHAAVHGVRLVGSRAYLYDHGEGLVILDVTKTESPVRLGNYHSPAFLGPMAKVGNLLYVTDFWNGLTILDVADPAAPALVGVYQTPLGPSGENLGINNWGIAIEGSHAYLAACRDGVHILNVSNPASPELMQILPPPTIPAPHWSVGLTVRDDMLHVAFRCQVADPITGLWVWRLRTYDLDPFAKYAVQSTMTLPGASAARVLVATDLDPNLFVGREHYAMQTIDVSDPTSPDLVYQGAAVLSDEAYDVAVENTLWVGARHLTNPHADEGIYLADVSDPSNPTPLAFVHGKSANAVALRNNRAYAIGNFTLDTGSTGIVQLIAFNVTDPMKPVPVALWPYVGKDDNSSMMVDESYIYVTTADLSSAGATDQGLMVLNVPPQPVPEDLNGDGVVNGFDLALLLGAWGACPARSPCPADLDGNGFVNGFDLALLLGAWTASR